MTCNAVEKALCPQALARALAGPTLHDVPNTNRPQSDYVRRRMWTPNSSGLFSCAVSSSTSSCDVFLLAVPCNAKDLEFRVGRCLQAQALRSRFTFSGASRPQASGLIDKCNSDTAVYSVTILIG
jgi:hypothetical protein